MPTSDDRGNVQQSIAQVSGGKTATMPLEASEGGGADHPATIPTKLGGEFSRAEGASQSRSPSSQ